MHERAARLPPVGACLGQALPPAHLGRVPAVLAVPVDLHLLARPRASRYVRPSCYGDRSVRSAPCMRGDPTACLLVEELLSPGHGARGQRRTGRAEPLSFRDLLERRPQAAPAHASLQGHRSAWHWRCVVAADEAHVPAGVAGVALEHLVRVVIPSTPDAAVVRLVLLGAAAHAAHPVRSSKTCNSRGGARRSGQTLARPQKENVYTARQQTHETRARRMN